MKCPVGGELDFFKKYSLSGQKELIKNKKDNLKGFIENDIEYKTLGKQRKRTTENVDRLYEVRNKEKYDGLPIPGVGQTCVNFLVKQHGIKIIYLPERYNLTDLFRKNLLHIPGHNGWSKDELIYKDVGYIFHFNAIPKNDRHVEYWMKRTYEEWFK